MISLVSFFIPLAVHATNFKLKSGAVADDRPLTENQVFNGFGCAGKNISPDLEWSGAPAGTKSYAITMYDPDAPTGSGWWHWTVYNLPASIHALPAGASHHLPAGAVEGRTDFGGPGFGGACPPVGDKPHRYVITVFALKTEKLGVPADQSAAMVGFALNSNTLARTSLTGLYSRTK